MSELSYPVAGGGAVTDDRYEKLMAEISGSGMIGNPTLTQLMWADGTGRQVKLKANRQAVIRGFQWETDGDGLTFPVEANTSGYPRLDLGVLRLDRSTYNVRFALKMGTPATTPVAPSVTQNTDADGVWEIPVGTVRVASTTTTGANSGLPSIALADITPLEYYIGPPPLITHSARMSAIPVRAGQQVTQYDKGRLFTALGSNYHLVGEDGQSTKLAVKSGWDNGSVWVTRRNGFVTMQAIVYRNTPNKSTPAGTDVVMFNLPDEFRPDSGTVLYLDGAHMDWFARCYLNPISGDVGILGYANTLQDNHYVSIHPVTWLAKY